ncbi:hypothetical protein [Luteimonas sp. 3794]|uniref:hypothetical protein n=1 Tax=Luteimonas sp. 3794 TaxID=2817730 RepID=UPI00285BDFAD|nr:hypothetical protein [Luteimonas sp. 3794]MDR6990175.1 hypothetical protein [Luteimonas sp. 3794]
MYDCPHCSTKSIGTWRKVSATPFSPAICGNCGKASFVSGWSNFATVLAAEVFLWGSIVFAIFLGSFYGLLALPVGMAVISILLAQLFPLIPANDFVLETRRKIVRRTWGFAVLAALALLIYGLSTHSAG